MTGDSIAIEPSLPRPASESSVLQFVCIDPVRKMLLTRPNVRLALVVGTSYQRHLSATRRESMRILFMIMKNQARHRLKVRAYVGKGRQYDIRCRHLDVNIALVLVSFGVEGSDLGTGQSETHVSSFVTNVPCVCCVFHYRPPYYVNPQQLYSSQHHLVLKTYKSTHNIRTLDHQRHVFLCCKDV